MSVAGRWPADEGRVHAQNGGNVEDCPYEGFKRELWERAFSAQRRLADVQAQYPKLRPEDACGCVKERGCWGDQGWHFRRWTAKTARRYLRTKADGTVDNEREPTDAEVARFLVTYTQPVAYEPCPAYRRAIQRNREREELLA